MKKHLAIVAAAAMALAGSTYAFAADDAGQSSIGKAASDLNQGVKDTAHEGAVKAGLASDDQASANMTPHAAKIHKTLGKIAEDAVTKDGNTDVADQFTKADRDRLDQNKDALKNDDTLNGRIAELQKDWKAKYGSDFNIKDQDKVFNVAFASIDEMPADAAARTASGTVPGEGTNNSTATPGASATPAPADNNVGNADNAKDMSRDSATVHIAESHGLPALDVPLVHEGMSWKVNIPDEVDSAKIKNNIQTALTEFDQNKDQWPADQDDAYRAVTHRVLLAVFDKPAMADTGANPSAAPSSANPSSATPSTPPPAEATPKQ